MARERYTTQAPHGRHKAGEEAWVEYTHEGRVIQLTYDNDDVVQLPSCSWRIGGENGPEEVQRVEDRRFFDALDAALVALKKPPPL